MVSIGIDVGGTGIQIGVVNERGEILCKGSIVTRTDIPFEQQVAQMAECALDTLKRSGFTLEDVRSVGAGVPGMIDQRTQLVAFCNNLGWRDVPFAQEMRRHIDKPIYVDNDARVAGLAESVAGVSAGANSSVFITLGTGVGGGIVLQGKIWSGAHGVGGEIGHMTLDLNGEPCNCGNKGCLERYCSATAIIRMACERLPEHPESSIWSACDGDLTRVNAKMVIDAAREKDAVGLEVFELFIDNLAQAITSFINILDPELVVLGGGVSRAGSFLLDAVREALPRYVLYKTLPYARVELARLGPDAGIIGAAMLGN